MIYKNILSTSLQELKDLHLNISNTPTAHGHNLAKKPFTKWLDVVIEWEGSHIVFHDTMIDLTGLKTV